MTKGIDYISFTERINNNLISRYSRLDFSPTQNNSAGKIFYFRNESENTVVNLEIEKQPTELPKSNLEPDETDQHRQRLEQPR